MGLTPGGCRGLPRTPTSSPRGCKLSALPVRVRRILCVVHRFLGDFTRAVEAAQQEQLLLAAPAAEKRGHHAGGEEWPHNGAGEASR